MLIDSHLHLIRKSNFDKKTYKELNMPIPQNTDLDELVTWLQEAGIKKAVAMGQDMTRIWKTTFGEKYLLKALKEYPDFFLGLASVEPIDEYNRFNQEGFEYVRKALTDYELEGVLLTPPYGHYNSNDKTAYPFYELVNEQDAVVQFHHSAQLGPAILAPHEYADLDNLNDILVDFPDLSIVIEHLGYPWSERLFTLMASDENLWTDLAQLYNRPYWLAWNLELAREYGVLDRVMYASDYVAADYDLFSDNPAADFKEWVNFLREDLNKVCDASGWPKFSEAELEGILGNNAARLYNIEN